jgi:hypothetical protein
MLKGIGLNVVAVLLRGDGSHEVIRTRNIISSDGDRYYSQRAAGETPTNVFDALHLGSGATTPAKSDTATNFAAISGSGKLVSTGYPKTNDTDADNTGKGATVVTWKFSYAAADGPFTGITEGIVVVGAAALTAGEPVLSHFRFAASFNKTTSDTLSVWLNHTAVGV